MKSEIYLPAKYSACARERTSCETLRAIKPAKSTMLNLLPLIGFIAEM